MYLLHAHASVSAFEGKGFRPKSSAFASMLYLIHSDFVFSNDHSHVFLQLLHRDVSVD